MLPDTGHPFSEASLKKLQQELACQGQLLWIDPEKGSMDIKEIALESKSLQEELSENNTPVLS